MSVVQTYAMLLFPIRSYFDPCKLLSAQTHVLSSPHRQVMQPPQFEPQDTCTRALDCSALITTLLITGAEEA